MAENALKIFKMSVFLWPFHLLEWGMGAQSPGNITLLEVIWKRVWMRNHLFQYARSGVAQMRSGGGRCYQIIRAVMEILLNGRREILRCRPMRPKLGPCKKCARSVRNVLASVLHTHILFAEVDQSLFQKKLSSSLRNHREYPQVIAPHVNGHITALSISIAQSVMWFMILLW